MTISRAFYRINAYNNFVSVRAGSSVKKIQWFVISRGVDSLRAEVLQSLAWVPTQWYFSNDKKPKFFCLFVVFFSLRPHWLSCNLPGKFIYSDTYRLHDIIKYSLICYFYFRRVNIYVNDDRCAKTSNPSPSNFLFTQMMAETFPAIFLSCYKFTCGFSPNILKPLSRRCFLISRIILETTFFATLIVHAIPIL